ncbi:alpha/beta hydrolase family protein [Desulfobaculum senezii]
MRWLRILCAVASTALHVTVLAAAIWLAGVELRLIPMRPDVYTVDIVDRVPPLVAEVQHPATPPVPPPPEPPQEQTTAHPAKKPVTATPPQPQTPPPAPRPAASSEPSAPPSAPASDPPSGPPAVLPDTGPPQPSAPKAVSSHGAASAPPPPKPAPSQPAPDDGPAMPGAYTDEDGTVHVGGLRGFAGFAQTFALERCGADTFVPGDYFGHYHMGGERFVSIIDGRDAFDAFLFYDSQTGLFKALRRDGEMVFAYGADFLPEEPVEGVVTILPKKDRYNNPLIKKPAQLMWMPPDPPMEYGTRITFTEEPITITNEGVRLQGTIVRRPDVPIRAAFVLVHCEHCTPQESALSMARLLALRGCAVLVYDGRGCGGSDVVTGPLTRAHQVSDALAAHSALRAAMELSESRVGLWGDEGGAELALLAAKKLEQGFLVCSLVTRGPARRTGQVTLAPEGLKVPSLWLCAGPDPAQSWRELRRRLGAVDGASSRFVALGGLQDAAAHPETVLPLPLRYGAAFTGWSDKQGLPRPVSRRVRTK